MSKSAGVASGSALAIQAAAHGESRAVALLLQIIRPWAGAVTPASAIQALAQTVSRDAIMHVRIVGARAGVVRIRLDGAAGAQAEAGTVRGELGVVSAGARILAAGRRVVQLGGDGVGWRARLGVARLRGVGAGARIVFVALALESAGERVGGRFVL